MEKSVSVLHKKGNKYSASIPLALVDAVRDGRIQEGDNLLLVGFGAGMTSASDIVSWGGSK